MLKNIYLNLFHDKILFKDWSMMDKAITNDMIVMNQKIKKCHKNKRTIPVKKYLYNKLGSKPWLFIITNKMAYQHRLFVFYSDVQNWDVQPVEGLLRRSFSESLSFPIARETTPDTFHSTRIAYCIAWREISYAITLWTPCLFSSMEVIIKDHEGPYVKFYRS